MGRPDRQQQPGTRIQILWRWRGRPLPRERWSTVTIPVLVLDGGASPEWQRTATRSLAGVLPNAEHRTLESQTHRADPEVLAPVVAAFLGA